MKHSDAGNTPGGTRPWAGDGAAPHGASRTLPAGPRVCVVVRPTHRPLNQRLSGLCTEEETLWGQAGGISWFASMQ